LIQLYHPVKKFSYHILSTGFAPTIILYFSLVIAYG